jgi:lipopolysaccharide export system protein LptA
MMVGAMMKPYGIALLLVAAPFAGAPASAQIGTSALRGHDSKAPIDVDAARIEVLDAQNQAIFSGGVKVRQAAMTIDAARIKVSYTRNGSSDPVIRRLDATGDVKLTTPSERATGRTGLYDVVLTRGTTVLRGNRLSIDLASGRSTIDGSSGQGGRVTGRFAVSKAP